MTDVGNARRLQVLIANEVAPRLEQLTEIVRGLGHDVVARAVVIDNVAPLTREAEPDVALVGLGQDSKHALALISKIVHEAACPVVAVLHSQDRAFISEAAKRGIFAYVTHDDPDELQSAIEIVLHRFAEFRNLHGAFGRRAQIERTKGILMERHRIDDQRAFDLLRSHSQHRGMKLATLARAIEEAHLLLPAHTPPTEGDEPA